MPPDENNEELEERQAHVVWAAHILSYLTKQKPHVALRQPPVANEEEGEEEMEPNDLDTVTEANAVLTDSTTSIQSKILDCIAQLLSPSKGWNYVTATAMRDGIDSTEIIVARNDCFFDAPFERARTSISEFRFGLENYLSTGSHKGKKHLTKLMVIEYCSTRVDYWINQLQDILGSVSKLPDWDRRRRPGHEQETSLWETLTEFLNQDPSQDSNQRNQIVQLAYDCVSSTEVHYLLHVAFNPQVASKLWTFLKYLARPITDCRLLRRIASRLPKFRNVRVSVVPPVPKTSIKPEYNVDITSAWTRLVSAPPSPSDLKVIVGLNDRFKRECVLANSLHAEMQLFDYLQKDTLSILALPYFGCSKKSCLLCEDFLHALSPPIATRGRHGICYPAWGVPRSNSDDTLIALKGLEMDLASRIKTYLQDSKRGPAIRTPLQVAQSSIVSGLSDMTIQELQWKEEQTVSAKQEEDSRREERRILEGHNIVARDPARPPVDFEPHDSCVMCNKSPAMLCERCRSCYYCSRQCQRSDYPSHKLLCRDFANQSPRPSPSHKRAIFFPVERTKPRLIWILCTLKYSSEDEGFGSKPFETIDLHPYLGPDKPYADTQHIEYNPKRDRNLGRGMVYWAPSKAGYSIALEFRETALVDGSAVNGSILESMGALGSPSFPWSGPIIAIRELPSEIYDDITLADFRHVLDHMASYRTTEVRESDGRSQTHSSAITRGVKICCYGETKLHGSDPFVLVDVPRAHPTRLTYAEGDISPISKLLGMPIRLWKFPDLESWLHPPGWEGNMCADSNQNAAFLMMGVDPKSDWGWAPLYWNIEIGNVLAVRADGRDLDLDDMRTMCYFARKKLLPMMEDSMGLGLVSRTKNEVLDFITWENMEKFRGEMLEDDDY
ncbi:hypothetical protein F4818DRAFT_435485 [Hypoxylon cercidicola]|nr:hypothetical protein F4818DRAFT_435485 [Hypoxylon cercidicola]